MADIYNVENNRGDHAKPVFDPCGFLLYLDERKAAIKAAEWVKYPIHLFNIVARADVKPNEGIYAIDLRDNTEFLLDGSHDIDTLYNDENFIFGTEVETYLMGDQPTTCPKCGHRTQFDEYQTGKRKKDYYQIHTCNFHFPPYAFQVVER